jgi:hypothetical protein
VIQNISLQQVTEQACVCGNWQLVTFILKRVHQFAPLKFHISSPFWVKFTVGDFM